VRLSLRRFPALRSKSYRQYLAGLTVSLVGTWIQQTTVALLAFRLTGSSAAVGAAIACTQLPILFLAPLAGAVNDRFDRRQVLICTQLAGLVQAALMLAAFDAHFLGATTLFSLSLCGGVINSLDTPARQSIVAALVDRPGDIRNAVAMNAAAIHVARLFGPAGAALLLGRWDAGPCFGANALSCAYFAFILANLGVKAHVPLRRFSLGVLREGFSYCMSHPATRQSLLWIGAASLLAIPYTSLLPAAAHHWSASAPVGYTVLMIGAGLGAFCAALTLAQIKSDVPLRRAIPVMMVLAAACLVLLGFEGARLSSGILIGTIALLGFVLTMVVSGGNVIIQNSVPEALRGRVTGLFVMLFNGVAPLGSMVWGFVADRFTLAGAFMSAGAALTVVLIFNRRATRT
jgi:MFS family permease